MDQAVASLRAVSLIDLKKKVEDVDVLFVYGWDESIYRSFLPWLKKNEQRYLVFVEREEVEFLRLQESALRENPKLRFLQDSGALGQRGSEIAWEFVFLRFGYACAQVEWQEAASQFFEQLEHFHRGIDLLASDSQDMGEKVLKNVIANLEMFPRSRPFHSLENGCAKIPAIICGAGPSLDHVASILPLVKERAILIAGGSAIKALDHYGISPHIGAVVDPELLLPSERFSEETFLFYQSRAFPKTLQNTSAPLVWIPGSGSYPLEGWLASESGIFVEPLDTGWTVANLCAVIADHLGCDPIIFVGVDFACHSKQVYAGNIGESKNQEELIPTNEKGLYSKKDWLMSAEWMSTFIKQRPKKQWWRGTKEGVEWEGVSSLSFSELMNTSLKETYDISGVVHGLVYQVSPFSVSSAEIEEIKKRLLDSFERSDVICLELLEIWEKYYPQSPLEKGEYLNFQHDLEEQICYRYFLLPLWNVWKRPILRSSFHPLGQWVHRLLFFRQAIQSHLSYLRG